MQSSVSGDAEDEGDEDNWTPENATPWQRRGSKQQSLAQVCLVPRLEQFRQALHLKLSSHVF